MNCKKCHHVDEIHSRGDDKTLLKIGRCLIPNCKCKQFVIPIDKIDEELV